MTVTAEQIEIAKSHGMQNVDLIAQCCNETGARFYIALAMLEKETGTCRNVYENDVGGTFRGFKDPVTECNWRAFRHEVITNGWTSNGVGHSQLRTNGRMSPPTARSACPTEHCNVTGPSTGTCNKAASSALRDLQR